MQKNLQKRTWQGKKKKSPNYYWNTILSLTFMYAASVSAMVRSSSLRVVRRRSRLSDTRFNFSVRTRMSCWRRVFSSSSCWIWLFSSSLLKNSSSIPEEREPIPPIWNVLEPSGGVLVRRVQSCEKKSPPEWCNGAGPAWRWYFSNKWMSRSGLLRYTITGCHHLDLDFRTTRQQGVLLQGTNQCPQGYWHHPKASHALITPRPTSVLFLLYHNNLSTVTFSLLVRVVFFISWNRRSFFHLELHLMLRRNELGDNQSYTFCPIRFKNSAALRYDQVIKDSKENVPLLSKFNIFHTT